MAGPGTRTALAGATALLLVSASPAFALFGGGANCASPTQVSNAHSGTRDVIREEHETTRNAIMDAIEEQTEALTEKMEETTLRIIEALTLAAKENSAHIRQQTESQRRVADAQELNATDRMRQEVRASAESGQFDPNPFSCSLLDIFESSRGSGAPMTGDGVTQRAVSRLSGDDEDVQAGGTQIAVSVVNARDTYSGFRGSENATTDWSFMLNEPTIDLSDPQMQDVLGWVVTNSVDPLPEPKMTAAELDTPEGMSMAAEAQKRIARQRAAIETINMSLNMRTPALTDNQGTFRSMADDSAYNRPVPERLSELQQLDIRTVYHYAPGPNRVNGTNGQQNGLVHMNEKGWLQELHTIMAINARINYIRLELENRNAVVNALILASLNER
ncbi:hypothetical protein IQ03_01219 [Gemmobacter caeni]|uniref:Secreted protein n=1 Tax=Gemmobacter caeni TaxID=589035 RepID=A0A2T6B923_9RHOB|nr:hypothetical protein [Gemmobacter caeni]PTX52528.1 hypothetical protein C8N34_102308 [Gemmobacter caeni]TWJ02801.1 hypothetical protein IQ03_01219 [Gemmobacter caeni]